MRHLRTRRLVLALSGFMLFAGLLFAWLRNSA